MQYDYQLTQNPTPATTAEAARADVAAIQTPAAGASPAAAFSRAPSMESRRRGLELLSIVQQYDALLFAGMSGPDSPQYGDWQPGPWFAKEAPAVTRPIPAGSEWMFSPCIAGPLVVRRMAIGTSFCFMPGLTIKFHFAAPFLADLPGAMVRLYYNPFSPECAATVVLADEYQGRPAGTVLGTAQQINRHARYTRRKLGYGSDPDIGQAAAKQHAQELRRHVVAIRPDGKPGLQAVETRTYSDSAPASAPAAPIARPSKDAPPRVPDQLLDRQAARARKLIALSAEH